MPDPLPRLYFDTNVFIALIEGTGERYPSLFRLAGLAGQRFDACTSEVTFGELLVRPYSEDEALAESYVELLTAAPRLQIIPVERSIIMRAAWLRSRKKGFKLPDAIHLATAEQSGCGIFLSHDKAIVPTAPMVRIGLSDDELDRLIESLA